MPSTISHSNYYFQQIGEAEYQYVGHGSGMQSCEANESMIDCFNRLGYIVVRNLFTDYESTRLVNAIKKCPDMLNNHVAKYTDERKDRQQFWEKTAWDSPPTDNDVMSCAIRTCKMAEVAETLLQRGEVYQYAAKLTMKRPRTGAAVLWHQDYGYWYVNQILTPDFISCYVALTKNDRENGGLQVLPQSHLCGRLDHMKTDCQLIADPERVRLLEKKNPAVACDLKPGDALFFHANTLHMSPKNESDQARWSLIITYNAKANSPKAPLYYAKYTEKLVYMAENAVAECDSLRLNTKHYVDFSKNPNVTILH